MIEVQTEEQHEETIKHFYAFLNRVKARHASLAPVYNRFNDIPETPWEELDFGSRALFKAAFEEACESVSIITKSNGQPSVQTVQHKG